MATSKRPKRPKTDVHANERRDDDEPKFRLRPRSARTAGRGDMGWSIALRTVLRYARNSTKSRKHSSRESANTRPRRSHNQRCAVRVTYSQNKEPGQWRAHGIYIARESASGKRSEGGFGPEESKKNTAAALDGWQIAGDERVWKVILSPEFGERVDLEQMTREVMKRSEKHLGTSLEWLAVSHFNTEHPHVHVVIRGRRDDGSPLNLPREFIKHGLRSIAEDACTLQLGPRTELDIAAAAEREVRERRYTSLDHALERRALPEYDGDPQFFRVNLNPAIFNPSGISFREQHLQSRLVVLGEMGLASQANQNEWLMRKDFSTVLRAMQLASDRQKMLASSGSLLSDQRLRLSVLDFRRTPEVQGRVLTHGEEEQASGAGRHYLLLEGTDAQVHMIFYTPEMEAARGWGRLKPNSFVRLSQQNRAKYAVLNVVDFGDANALLENKSFLRSSVQKLIRQGIVPNEEGWGGWLGDYQSAIRRAAVTARNPDKNRSHER